MAGLQIGGQRIGDGIEQTDDAESLAVGIDDDIGSVTASAVATQLDFLVSQVGGVFVTPTKEAEGVVFFHLPLGLGMEQLIVKFRRRQEANTFVVRLSRRILSASQTLKVLPQPCPALRLLHKMRRARAVFRRGLVSSYPYKKP